MDRVVLKQGAEAKLELCSFYGKPCLVKVRFQKKYRHPALDMSLTTHRMKSEVRAIIRCRANGIRTPTIYMVDIENSSIYMEYLEHSVTVKEYIASIQSAGGRGGPLLGLAAMIGTIIGRAHKANIIHGDLTTSNMLLVTRKVCQHPEVASASSLLQMGFGDLDIVLIDFGLTALDGTAEDKGVDLYVLERALLSTHPNSEHVFEAILDSYKKSNNKGFPEVIKKLEEVRSRGRKRTMVG